MVTISDCTYIINGKVLNVNQIGTTESGVKCKATLINYMLFRFYFDQQK